MSAMKVWAVPAAAVVAIEYFTALLIGSTIGFHYSIPSFSFFIVGLTIAGSVTSLWIVLLLAKYARQGEAHPSRRLLTEAAPRFLAFLVGVVLVTLQMAVLMWLKVMLPISSPFWADPLLADVDAFIFRTDPWRLTHGLLGWAGPLFDRIYVTWAPTKFATMLFVLLQPEDRRKAQAIVAYFLMVAISAIGQYSLSSGGPVFYERLGFGPRFEGLQFLPALKPIGRASREGLVGGDRVKQIQLRPGRTSDCQAPVERRIASPGKARGDENSFALVLHVMLLFKLL